MTAPRMHFVSVCGMLGYGFPQESLRLSVEGPVDFLGADNGSTDPGPYYLGAGTSFLKPTQVRRDLELALLAARSRNVPLVIGSAGGSGAAPHVASFVEVLREIAARRNLHFRLAVIHADIDRQVALDALQRGKITPCGPSGPLTPEKIAACTHLVGQMGTGPLIQALQQGADVVVAGRCCDTAIFAAMPIMRGFDPGLAMHLGKIAECGTLCARPGGANDVLMCELAQDHFVVRPANPQKSCTPDSVAAHSLYEQPDPNCFYEPEGKVDLSACTFEPCGERGVRVAGTRLIPPTRPTIKLEGASLKGYRCVTVAGARDPALIAHLDEWEAAVRKAVADNLVGVLREPNYTLRFLRYGLDGVIGRRAGQTSPQDLPAEVGLVLEAIAPSQELADTVLSLARSTALHQPFTGRKTTAGNLAFPFSPSDLRGGAVYEFTVYHLMETDEPDALFPITLEQV